MLSEYISSFRILCPSVQKKKKKACASPILCQDECQEEKRGYEPHLWEGPASTSNMALCHYLTREAS